MTLSLPLHLLDRLSIDLFNFYVIIPSMAYKRLKSNSVTLLLSLAAIGMSVGSVALLDHARSDPAPADDGPVATQETNNATSTGALVFTETGGSITEQARHLHDRLVREGSLVIPPLALLQNALRERQELLKREITVSFDVPGQSVQPWTVQLSQHPEWLTLHRSLLSARFQVDPRLIVQELQTNPPPFLPVGRDADATDLHQDGKVQRVRFSAIAQRGYAFDLAQESANMAAALTSDDRAMTITLRPTGGTVLLHRPDGSTEPLSLLGSGKSDFSDSTPNRLWNVHKAIDERINGLYIPAGSTFSFVDALDVPVTVSKGWKEDLGLFGGGTAKTPGAGICQAATTTYRAAMYAGLPIVARRAHSMFVDHYEKYGVGMDATVFPGTQDLAFRNDTDHDIVVQAYTVGDDAFVNFYGVPDNRRVVVQGPYFNTTQGRDPLIRALAGNEIGWVRRVVYSDGTTQERPFISTYVKGFFHRVKVSYPVETIELLHAAAPVQTAMSL